KRVVDPAVRFRLHRFMNLPRFSLLLMLPGSLAFAQEIRTDQLAVSYDAPSGSFSATDRATGRRFVTSGRLDRVEANSPALVKGVNDSVFGSGSQLVIAHAGAGETRLELYPGLPFLVVRETLTNTGDEELDVRHAVPTSF